MPLLPFASAPSSGGDSEWTEASGTLYPTDNERVLIGGAVDDSSTPLQVKDTLVIQEPGGYDSLKFISANAGAQWAVQAVGNGSKANLQITSGTFGGGVFDLFQDNDGIRANLGNGLVDDPDITLQVGGRSFVQNFADSTYADLAGSFYAAHFVASGGKEVYIGDTYGVNVISGGLALQYAAPITFFDGDSDESVTLASPNTLVDSYALIWPDDQGGAGETLINDGSGNLSWGASGGSGPWTLDSDGNMFSTDTGLSSNFGPTNTFFSGETAGNAAILASDSVFIGNTTGFQAEAANNSVFLGAGAGYQASDVGGDEPIGASSSVFIGGSAGYQATHASDSVFLGHQAGYQAAGANLSIHIGSQAGYTVTSDSDNQIFLGTDAGSAAAGADDSVYIGHQAGFQSNQASLNNFIGYQAGYQIEEGIRSNFIGYQAGYDVGEVTDANFFGHQAGREATDAYGSFFVGAYAGYQAADANNAIFIGSQAGINDTVDNSTGGFSIAIGPKTGTGGFSNSVVMGHGSINTAELQMNFGNVLYINDIYDSNTQDGTPVSGSVDIYDDLHVFGKLTVDGPIDPTYIEFTQISTPSNPASGKNRMYFKSDDKAYRLDSAGNEVELGGGGGGLDLEVDGTPNTDQTLLNLISGSNISITDDGMGGVTIQATGSGFSPFEAGAGLDSAKLIGATSYANGDYSVAEGVNTTADGDNSHAEGTSSIANGIASHAEGYNTTADGQAAHAEGQLTVTDGDGAHAEGNYSQAIGQGAHAEGTNSIASQGNAHAEGADTEASGAASHSEGNQTVASGTYSHAEGQYSVASGNRSHAEGNATIATGESSHAEGLSTKANYDYSHVEGWATEDHQKHEHVEGMSASAYEYSRSHLNLVYDEDNSVLLVGGVGGSAIQINEGWTYSMEFNIMLVNTDFSVDNWHFTATAQMLAGAVSGVGDIYPTAIDSLSIFATVPWGDPISPTGPGIEDGSAELSLGVGLNIDIGLIFVNTANIQPGARIHGIVTINKMKQNADTSSGESS